jgi:hypothetical protein
MSPIFGALRFLLRLSITICARLLFAIQRAEFRGIQIRKSQQIDRLQPLKAPPHPFEEAVWAFISGGEDFARATPN